MTRGKVARGALALAFVMTLAGCAGSINPYSPAERTLTGGVIGAGTGAAIGGATAGWGGAAIGAAVGGAVGAVAGAATTPSPSPRPSRSLPPPPR